MDPLVLYFLAAGLSIAPLPLMFRCVHSRTATWISVLAGLGSALLAVGFFWIWQSLEYPVLAYLDGAVYGLLALLAAFVPINRWLGVPGSTPEE